MAVPLIRPSPPLLSQAAARLREIEDSGVFSNFGPVNTRLEHDMVARLFAGEGACVAVCNATIGLMLALQQAIGVPRKSHCEFADFAASAPRHAGRQTPGVSAKPRYALMPSFTFAAAAQAALWCGLTPLFCDIDPTTWTACAADEERLLARHGSDIAVVMPYATFGYDLDLSRYAALTRRCGVPVVVDAAASLGTASADGRGFGTGFAGSVVFSMHATKSFATGEGGIVYSADPDAIAQLRQMCNFGFAAKPAANSAANAKGVSATSRFGEPTGGLRGQPARSAAPQPRTATMPGLNGKLSEVGALLAHLRLDGYPEVLSHRAALMRGYRQALPELTYQPELPGMQAHQFAPGLLPPALASFRGEITAALAGQGIGSATYFSPHLAQQDYFAEHGAGRALPVTDDVASRIVSLPLFEGMTSLDLVEVTTAVQRELMRAARTVRRRASRRIGPPALPAAVLVQHVPPDRTPAQT